jgi:hypothetical protein
MVLNALLVVGTATEQRTIESTKFGKNLLVSEAHPTEDGSVVLFGLAEESGLLVLRRDCLRIVSLEKQATKPRNVKRGVEGSEFVSLNRCSDRDN